MSMRQISAFAISLLFIASCGAAELRANCASGLEFNANIDPKVRDFHVWENLELFAKFPHISGTLRIANKQASPVAFSTAMVMLSGKGVAQGRAYVESVASHKVDIATVEIQQGQSLILRVYWAVPLELGTTLAQAELSCSPANTSLGADGQLKAGASRLVLPAGQL